MYAHLDDSFDDPQSGWRAQYRRKPQKPPHRGLVFDGMQTPADSVDAEEGTGQGDSPRILFVEAYCSFSNNVISLIHRSISTSSSPADIQVIKIDDPRFQGLTGEKYFCSYVQGFDAVVAGSGPGNPTHEADVGIFKTLWQLADEDLVPVLGICLGFQSMCHYAGAQIRCLREPRHGIITSLCHSSSSIFSGLGEILATHYHSLHVDIDHSPQPNRIKDIWMPSTKCPRIQPLAWDYKDADNGPVLMAAKILDKPFCGMQFHPESVCTNEEGKKVIGRWWTEEVEPWLCRRRVDNPNENSVHKTEKSLGSMKREASEDFLNEREGLKRLRLDGHSKEEAGMIEDSATHKKKDSLEKEANSVRRPRTFQMPPLSRTLSDQTIEDDCSEPPDEEYSEDSLNDVHEQPSKIIQTEQRFGGFSFSDTVLRGDLLLKDSFREQTVEKLFGSILHCDASERLLLESGMRRSGTGQNTIIAVPDEDETIKICYYRIGKRVRVFKGLEKTEIHSEQVQDFWEYIQELDKTFKCEGGDKSCTFWGGLFWAVTYEACLERLDINGPISRQDLQLNERPCIIVTVVLRSVVVDHQYKDIFVQSIKPNDEEWVRTTCERIEQMDEQIMQDEFLEKSFQQVLQADIEARKLQGNKVPSPLERLYNPKIGSRPTSMTLEDRLRASRVSFPTRAKYESNVKRCDEFIRAGDSYELCLTDQSVVRMLSTSQSQEHSWMMYRNLMRLSPAPFGAFLHLQAGRHDVTIMSSSPERFVRWTREGKVQYRPIKGTLPRTPSITQTDAEHYFQSTKERSENLMIADLILHDLRGVIGPGQGTVAAKMFQVEQYPTCYQLVSIIEGWLPKTNGAATKTGLDVLMNSLPPGSMTGAPKKRSCEILQEIENGCPRGIYSGVLGYTDVGGGGDFSVVIRTASKWNDEDSMEERRTDGATVRYEHWHVGAGGAVTAKSTPEGEFEEMCAKRNGVLKGAFISESESPEWIWEM